MSDKLPKAEGHKNTHIVISAINIFQGGALTVAKEFLSALASILEEHGGGKWRVTFFCHRRLLYQEFDFKWLKFIEIPTSRKSWFLRLYYEYLYFNAWSKKEAVDFWISLHDITPRVHARLRFVYCHNPAPFYIGPTMWRDSPQFEFFRNFYLHLYRINLDHNDGIIVQQAWIRDRFMRAFRIPQKRFIVAHPVTHAERTEPYPLGGDRSGNAFTLFYPAVPRPFKNFEVLLRMMELSDSSALKLVLTFDGSENRYAKRLVRRYSHLRNVVFLGLVPHATVQGMYKSCDVVVFPSKLETWGLPISEAKKFGKIVLAADLPYAHESVGDYDYAEFFHPDDFVGLLRLVSNIAAGNMTFRPHIIGESVRPDCVGWLALVRAILGHRVD